MQLLKSFMIMLLKGYKLCVSPLLGNRCRFYPSCSTYAQQAIEKYGPFKGAYYAFIRLAKCGPFHPGGYDPVEEIENKKVVHKKCKC